MQQFFSGHGIVHNRLAEEEIVKDYMVLKVSSKVVLSYSTKAHKKNWVTDLCKCINTHTPQKISYSPQNLKVFLLNTSELFLFVIISVQENHSSKQAAPVFLGLTLFLI